MNDRPSAVPATGKKTLWAWAVGTFFGAGLLKPGPGTWGSVAALLLWAFAICSSISRRHIRRERDLLLLTVYLHRHPGRRYPRNRHRHPRRNPCRTGIRPRRPRPRRHRRSRRPMADASGLPSRLAARPPSPCALPPLRHHQAVAHPETGGAARRLGHHAGRSRGRIPWPDRAARHPALVVTNVSQLMR